MSIKRFFLSIFVLWLLGIGAVLAQKKYSAEYLAQRQASIIAMDSILKYSQKMPVDIILRFADDLCKKYKNDPVLMDSIAEGFYRFYNNEVFGERRYNELKKMHPEYTQVYLNEARLFHAMAWTEDAEGWHVKTELLEKAKAKLDSAKIMMPSSPEPYLLWMRLQSPFRHTQNSANVASIDAELDQCKAKFPDYPCYLDAARQYEEILAKKDKTLLLDAAEFYEKAGEHDELTAPYWTNFALTVFNYYRSFDKPDYGVTIAKKGLAKYPDHLPLLRAKLWNEGIYEKWDDVIETSKLYFANSDTLESSYNDYKFVALAYEKAKEYEKALEFFNKELELVKDPSERLRAMGSMVNCYNRLSQYNQSLALFPEYTKLKADLEKPMEYFDYNPFISAYEYAGNDTLLDRETRKGYLLIADSLLQLSSEASPEYVTMINERRLNPLSLWLVPLLHDVTGNQTLSQSEVLEAAQRLVASVQELAEKKDIDYYRLMMGYNYMLLYYLMNDDNENVYLMTEKMLSVDMPSEMELTTLRDSYKKAYAGYVERAMQLNVDKAPKTKKKRKR